MTPALVLWASFARAATLLAPNAVTSWDAAFKVCIGKGAVFVLTDTGLARGAGRLDVLETGAREACFGVFSFDHEAVVTSARWICIEPKATAGTAHLASSPSTERWPDAFLPVSEAACFALACVAADADTGGSVTVVAVARSCGV
ncbi:hypothetical protein BaRGS_00007367 [Batillaria attramentaria]|uniref:Secreted protein n=1 Tax=Batillaria attramentaria TaxID=370345 RepID=A0ABD0LNS6_9CAEN